ncbi:MAG TPA: amidohydrolase family protein [Hyphomicrobiaceae bacterium]|jgi:cytosine/adenosine deaminase-related metal-dependent hydrolase|nr:amidohydrolase family protein [Hyphomicrobiaceae bacterium]
MCILCDRGKPQAHLTSRRNFLKGTAATGLAAGAMGLLGANAAVAQGFSVNPPPHTGTPGRRYVIRNAYVMTMEPGTPGADSAFGEFIEGDVLVEGKTIKAIGKNLSVGNAAEIDARGKVVMPGFIDTHHHQAWTPIRSSIPDSILINDFTGTASAEQNYAINVLGFGAAPALPGFAEHYTPEDVYIGELFGGLSQLDAGVTTVHDISQIHHSKEHSLAAIQALRDTGRRAKFGFFESAGGIDGGSWYPSGANFLRNNVLTSDDSLVTMVMGGEVYLGNATTRQSWTIGRNLGLQVAAHILSPFGIRPILDQLAGVSPDVVDGSGADLSGIEIGADNLFVHMTGMSDAAWEKVALAGAKVSIAFPIEMNMRHGMPPILKMQQLKAQLGIDFEPSLSVDVETNMTADFFTQMRSAMTMQRLVVNQRILELGTFSPPFTSQWPLPPYPADIPPLLNARDVLRFATINGAKHLRLDSKTGSLKVGKEADIIVLDGTHLNVFPMNNVPGAVVTLMERTNVETVIVAGKIRKWKGKLQDVDLDRLRPRLAASRDRLYAAVGKTQSPFPAK